jgi:AraC-like DNA-binding protein
MKPDEVEAFIYGNLYQNKESVAENTLLIKLQIFRINLFKIIFTIEVILTLFFGLKLIKSFNQKVYAFYSNVENRELSKIKKILIFFVLASFISSISNLFGKDYFTNRPFLLLIVSLAHSTVLFGISYVGYKLSFSIRELIKEPSIEEPVSSAENTDNDLMVDLEYDSLFIRIKELFDSMKLYKDHELKITDIALHLGTNRTYISRVIHNHTNLNFCDFVNEYRVKHAEELLSSTKEPILSLEEIGSYSGFSSNSSFYRAFVKKNGIPPGRYRKIRITHINS